MVPTRSFFKKRCQMKRSVRRKGILVEGGGGRRSERDWAREGLCVVITKSSFLKIAIPTIILDPPAFRCLTQLPLRTSHQDLRPPHTELPFSNPVRPSTDTVLAESPRNSRTYKTDLGDHSTPGRPIFSPCLPSVPFTSSSCTHTSHHPRHS